MVDRWRSLTALALLSLGLVLALAAGRGVQLERADFAFCNQFEIGSLDPAIVTGAPGGRILRAVYEGLTRLDPETLEPLPAAAASWTRSADGLQWRFRMREDAVWTNGEPVTAHDFAFSFRRLLAPETGAAYANLLWIVEGAEDFTSATSRGTTPDPERLGIHAPRAGELVLRLRVPCAYLLSLLAYYPLFPVHRGTLEAHGRDWLRPEHLVTNGPFRLVERRVRDRIRLERFEHYWGVDDVALRTIDAYAAEGATTQLNMFLTGQVDWMIKPPTSLYDELAGRPERMVGTQLGLTFFRFNLEREPFTDERVRRALTLVLDREGLARDVMRGGEQPAAWFVPPGLPGYEPAHLPPADPDRARALLAAAGFPGGAGFPAVELLYPSNEITRDFCEAVATQWRRELGVEMRLANQAFKVYLDSTKQGQYDVAWSSWIGDYLDPSTFLDCFLSTSGNNRTGWVDAEYDELLGRAAVEPDTTRRATLLRTAEQRLLDAAPIAPVYQRTNYNLVATRVRGFHNNLLDTHPLRDLRVVDP